MYGKRIDTRTSYYYSFRYGLLIWLFIAGLILCHGNLYSQDSTSTFRLPGEFEQQKAVWFGWDQLDSTAINTVANIIKGLNGKVPVRVVVQDHKTKVLANESLSRRGVTLDSIIFCIVGGDRFWIRDNGAVFLTDSTGNLGVADFQWSSYGYFDWLLERYPEMSEAITTLKEARMNSEDSKLDQRMAALTRAQVISSPLVMEGGALESNGKGVLLQCEQVTLQRNPGWTKEAIEAEFKRVLNIEKVIWLREGTIDDGRSFIPYNNYRFTGTGGHLDEFVRFANDSTILLAWVEEEDRRRHPLNELNYQRMATNYEILKNATDQDGKPFRIIKVPLPDIVELDQPFESQLQKEFGYLQSYNPEDEVIHVASVSYLNFLLVNDVIINASYVRHGTRSKREKQVKAIFEEVFPDRRQVWIDALPLNRRGGGIHCISLPEPTQRISTCNH